MPNQLVYEALKNKVINVFEKDNMRTFIDIRDFVNSLIFFLENFRSLKHSVYNIGDDKNNITKGQLCEIIQRKTGCFVNYVETYKDADARNYRTSLLRMQSAGFRCQYSLEDTVDQLIKAYPLLKGWDRYN